MSIKNVVSGWVLAFCIGATPALAEKTDKKSHIISPALISLTQGKITTVLETDSNSGLSNLLTVNPPNSRGNVVSEAFLKEFRTMNEENAMTSQLMDLMKKVRSNISTEEQKDYMYMKASGIINAIWGNSDMLFRVGLTLTKHNEMFGFVLIRQSLDLSKKHQDDMDPLFENILERIEQDRRFGQDLTFMIETFGPFLRESVTQKLNDPELPEPQKIQFKNALDIIEAFK